MLASTVRVSPRCWYKRAKLPHEYAIHRHGHANAKHHPRLCCRLSTPAHQEHIAIAEEKLKADDRLGALNAYEKALKDDTMDISLRKKLLFNSCCIHASYGDLELAQVPLREAIGLGLDFESAAKNPEPGMMKLKTSQQLKVSLKRFAKTVGVSSKDRPAYNPVRGMQLTPAGVRTAMSQEDVSTLVGTDMRGGDMDKSLAGIFKRVALLVAALIGLGAALYVAGLQFMFPDGI